MQLRKRPRGRIFFFPQANGWKSNSGDYMIWSKGRQRAWWRVVSEGYWKGQLWWKNIEIWWGEVVWRNVDWQWRDGGIFSKHLRSGGRSWARRLLVVEFKRLRASPGERKDIMERRGRLEIIWVYIVRRSTSGYAIVFRSSREMYAERRPHFLPTSRGEFSKANVNKKKRGRICWRCNLELYLAAWL